MLPNLYVFSISHYCEKARWALEYCAVEYRLRRIAPGFHRKKAKALGLRSSALPILETDEGPISGSSAIIDWADSHSANGKTLTPTTPKGAEKEARAIEQRLDAVLGVHIRRYYYSEAMVKYPKTVRPIFLRGLPLLERLAVMMKWEMIRDLMIQGMDLGKNQGDESRAVLDEEMKWLDGLLKDGRNFLVGDQFSRADLTAASLLAPLAFPDNHGEYQSLIIPPDVSKDRETWSARPCLNWVNALYKDYR